MKSEIEKRQDDRRSWAKYSESWESVPLSCSALAVVTKDAQTLEPLRNYKKLRKLYVAGIRPQDVEVIGSLQNLNTLFMWDVRTIGLKGISTLRSLEALSVQHSAKLESLDGCQALKSLRFMRLYHVPRVTDLAPLAALTKLMELTIETSHGTSKRLAFRSLKPLERLKQLRLLELRGVTPLDGSLRPLCSLKRLEYVFPCSYTLPVEEYARLAGCLRLPEAEWGHPTLETPNLIRHCKKCRSTLIMFVGALGRRYKQFGCPNCDAAEIAEREEVFKTQANRKQR